MAYKLYYGSNALFDPTTDNVVYDAKMTAKTNTSDYLDFTVPYGHDLYSSLAVKAETVKLYWDKDCLYVGTIESIETDLEGNLSVICTGALDWLADTVVRPYSTIEGKYELTAPSSVDGLFDWYVDQHNQHCMDSKKHFSVGVNQGALLDENNYIYRASGQLPTTLDEIKSKIIDNLGGYLFVRYEPLTVDLYADVYQKNAQIIDFGVNITDFSSVTDSEDQYTAIRPEGATPNKEEGEEDDPSPITIESLPDGGVGGYPDLWKAGDVVYSVSGAARYGYREYAYANNDCETQDGLLISACKKLNSLLSPQLSITVKAVDLALFMDSYTHLKVGEAVRVRSKFHGVDEYLMVQSIELDLQDPSQSTYELGAEYSTLTGQQSSYLKSLNSGINSALDATSALSSETKAAAKNAQEAKNEASDASAAASEAKTAADKAVVSTNVEYVQSDSATDVPGTGWSTTPPAWVDGKYIWMRYVITYGNGTVETTEGVVLTGNTGAQGIQGIQGPKGEDGIQGPKGEDGNSTYFHIKYAPVENPTAAQMTETPDIYIGTYVDTTQEDSTDPAKYTWARFQGLQGEKGDQGIPGVGEDGKTSYLHIKYSDDGVTFTGNDGEDPGNYIGQYTDFTQADSKMFSDYTWSLIKGSDGEDGTDGTRGKSVLNVSTYPVTDGNIYEYKEDTTDENVYVWQQDDLKTDTGLSEILVGDTVQVGTHQYVISELDDDWSPSPVSLVDDGISLASDTDFAGYSVAKAVGRSVTRPAILSLTTEPETYQDSDGTIWYDWILATVVNEVGVYDVGLGDIIQVGEYQYVVDAISGSSSPYLSPYEDYYIGSRARVKITGENGQNGTDGNGVASTEVTYQASSSGTVTPTGTWSTSVPTVTQGQYLWTKTVTIYTDSTTSTSYSVAYQAEDGAKGDDGKDGISPTVDTSKSGTTTTITITDADGTKTATVEDGTDGKDGKSPTATVTKSGDTATITVNNTDGTKTTAQVTDGTDGKDGKSPTATVTKSGTTSTITVNNTDGTTTSVKVLDGSDGKDGEDGTDGKDGKMLYGTCTTAGDTVAKIATVTGFTLTAGTTVSIKFTYANSAEAPTLNINSLGAKPILTNGTTYAYWAAGASVIFAYDGTRFQVCSTPVYADTVTVGNPAGQNVYIDSDSVDIRSGTESVSSFSNGVIELGKNSLNSKILMCKGAAVISASEKEISLSNTSGTMIKSGRDVKGEQCAASMAYAYSNGNVGNVKLLAFSSDENDNDFNASILLSANALSGKEYSSIEATADYIALDGAISAPVPKFSFWNQNTKANGYDEMNNSSATWADFYMFSHVDTNYDAFSSTGGGWDFSDLLEFVNAYKLKIKQAGVWDIVFIGAVSNAGTSSTDYVGSGIFIDNVERQSSFQQVYAASATAPFMNYVHLVEYLEAGQIIKCRNYASYYGKMYTAKHFTKCVMTYLGNDQTKHTHNF